MLVEDSDTYTLNAIGRDASGEYKCSLADNEKMEASQSIAVSCEYFSVHVPLPLPPIRKAVTNHNEAPLFTPKMSR